MPPVRDFFIRVELEFVLLQEFIRIGQTLRAPFLIALVNPKRGRQIRRPVGVHRQLVQIGAVRGEFRKITLQKVFVAGIERINIAIKKLDRHLPVEGVLHIVEILQHLRGDKRDARIIRPRFQGVRGQTDDRRRRWRRQRHAARLTSGPDGQSRDHAYRQWPDSL